MKSQFLTNIEKTTKDCQSGKNLKIKCRHCNDTGYICIKDHVFDVARYAKCKCKVAREFKQIWEVSGFTEISKDKTFKNFCTNKSTILKKMKDKATKYIENFNNSKSKGIAFLGQVGSGKTHLCFAICNELFKKDICVRYMQYREDITKIKRTVLDDINYNKIITPYKTCNILYIDDLYKGKLTEADLNIMFEIINYRYLHKLPIIISCELFVDRLVEIDEGIGSRIVEMCKGNIIEIKKNMELNYRIDKG